MAPKDLFYKWVPLWVRLPVLIILYFVILSANGVYLGNATDMSSGLGVYPEPFTEAYNAVYIGMGLGLLVEFRLKMRFTGKTLLLWGFTMMGLMNLVCMWTANPRLMAAACLVLGFCKISALIELYIAWLPIWSKKGDRSRIYPYVYFTALSGVYFVTWLTAQLADTYNWHYAYIIVLIGVLVCILFSLIFTENHALHRPLPLYQMDILGLLLLLGFLLFVNYTVVYFRVENGWESEKIRAAVCCMPVALLAFLLRELTVKRPLVPFRHFRKAAFGKGLVFFLLLGIFLPSTIQGVFTAGVLEFEHIRNAQLNLYLIPGVGAAALLCYFWYYYKQNADILFFIGVAAFFGYYSILYNKLATGLGMDDFWAMSVLKGFATGILYVVIGLSASSEFPFDKAPHASGMTILVRSFLGSAFFSGIYSYLLYAGRIRHLDILAGNPDTDAGNFLRPTGYYRNMQVQAAMAASKELCGAIIIAALVILVAIVFSHFYRLHTDRRRILN